MHSMTEIMNSFQFIHLDFLKSSCQCMYGSISFDISNSKKHISYKDLTISAMIVTTQNSVMYTKLLYQWISDGLKGFYFH